jgi:dihydroorotase/N-acyl-D-amino-acid deacylase
LESILLRGGLVIDGTGAPARRADVLIQGERVAAVGHVDSPADALKLDCTGLTVAPGFIDAHTHSDLQVVEGRPDKLMQGVTTEVVGNCGFSAYPAGDLNELRQYANGLLCGNEDWGWRTAAEYLEAVAVSPAANVGSLIGHGSLRIAVAGNRQGPLPEADVQAMESLVDEALAAGAVGFSTGLMYAPGSSAPFEELVRLCKVVSRRGKTYTTHMRSYFSGVVDAIQEQVELARRSGCRLQISHLQIAGAKNWGLQGRVMETIESAQAEGLDIAFDCYPYVAGSTVLTQVLPQWTLDGGAEALLGRLTDKDERRQIAQQTEDVIEWRWEDIYISATGSKSGRSVVGRNLAELAEARSKAPVDVMIDLLIEERANVNMLSFNQSEENLRKTLSHPLSMVISDGFYVRGRPHPRLHGTFPLLLGTMVRSRGWLPLETAIQKITDAPAQRFHLKGRGRLASGYFADVTVFDAAEVDSPASYEEPERKPVGIRHVFRNGRPAAGLSGI